MSELAHAEIGKIHTTNVDKRRAIRAIGVVQPSCITPGSWQSPWRNRRGGVVDWGDGLVGPGIERPRDNLLCQVSVSDKSCLFMRE